MSADRLAINYAKALFQVAGGVSSGGNGPVLTDKLEAVGQEVVLLSEIVEEVVPLRLALTSPQSSAQEKAKIAEEVCTKMQTSELVCRFFKMLAVKDRIGIICQIADKYKTLVDESVSVVRGVVSTADTISASQVKELEAAFGKRLKKTVKLETKIDRSLLGGLVVQIGNLTFDGSLNTALNSIQNKLERQYI